MAYIKKALVVDEYLTGSTTQIGGYAVPANTTTEVHSVTLHNTNTSAEVVLLYYVPSAGAAGGDNKKLAKTLAPDETFEWSPYHYLTAGDQFHGSSTTASKVNIRIDGAEVTQ